MLNILKKLIPHLFVVLGFILLSFIYFPSLLDGKVIKQGDITQFKGMSKEISDYREQTGKEPLWTNSMFGGMPAYQISTVYHHNIAKTINSILSLNLDVPAVYLFLALIGFYILMLVLGANVWVAVAGAIAFAFSSYFFIIESAGHNSKTHAMTFMAPMLAGLILTYRGKYYLGAAVFGLFLALQLFANHLQITYYTAMMLMIFVIIEFIQAFRNKEMTKFIKGSVILGVVALFAVTTNVTNLLLTWEYGKESTRGKSELTSQTEDKTSGLDKSYILNDYSYGIGEIFNLFIPNFEGGASYDNVGENSEVAKFLQSQNYPSSQIKEYVKHMPTYWGQQRYTAGPVYIGAVVIFLFVLGLFLIKGPWKWWAVSATLLAIFLAWGRNLEWFSNLFIHYFPGYNKFRTVSMVLVIAELTIPVFAMLTFIKIIRNEFEKPQLLKALKFSLYIAGGFALLVTVFASAFNVTGANDDKLQYPQEMMNAILSDRVSILRSDAFRTLIFVLCTAGLIWMILKNKIKTTWASMILAILFLLDLGLVGKRYLSSDNFVNKREAVAYQPSEADLSILQDKTNYRVYNLTVDPFNDASTSYFHKSIGGYHGAKLKRYQELIENQLGKGNIQVLNMLNAKYVIVPGQNQQPVAQINAGALGNAWFIDTVQIVANADQEIAALTKLNPKTKVVVDQRFKQYLTGNNFQPDSTASISLTSYQPNYLTYQSKASKEQLAVFSEIYYPKGWNVYLDGKQVSHFRADYVLRAMIIPAGTHKIEFRFDPPLYKLGENISLASSIILGLILLGAFGFEIVQIVKKEKLTTNA